MGVYSYITVSLNSSSDQDKQSLCQLSPIMEGGQMRYIWVDSGSGDEGLLVTVEHPPCLPDKYITFPKDVQ